MDKIDQFLIIQEIANIAISAADPDWHELMITYYVDSDQSEFGNSYLITQGGVTREEPLPVAPEMEVWMRRLRADLAKGGQGLFTKCKVHLHADGKFNASYGYEPVDWDELLTAGWNFSSMTSLH